MNILGKYSSRSQDMALDCLWHVIVNFTNACQPGYKETGILDKANGNVKWCNHSGKISCVFLRKLSLARGEIAQWLKTHAQP